MSEMHETDRLGTNRIGRLLWEFSVPAIIGMLVNASYNIVDRIYVGQGVDPLRIVGITVVMPAMMVLMALSMLIGIGAFFAKPAADSWRCFCRLSLWRLN